MTWKEITARCCCGGVWTEMAWPMPITRETTSWYNLEMVGTTSKHEHV